METKAAKIFPCLILIALWPYRHNFYKKRDRLELHEFLLRPQVLLEDRLDASEETVQALALERIHAHRALLPHADEARILEDA